jgi:BirA family biotin operon repressor/biotin-[acetyl-CoA-carboxylase] ligase
MDVPTVPLEVIDTTPSTMDVARASLEEGRVTFDAAGRPSSWGVFAHEQTAGRGQRGRAWYGARGESLCATYFIRHGFALPREAGWIPLLAGVVVAGVLEALGTLPRPGLKWPNDLLLNGRKAGGILIEMARAADGEPAALVGVGINVAVREFPPDLRGAATSLALESANSDALPSPYKLAWAIGAALGVYAGGTKLDHAAWITLWRELDATTGRRYEFEIDGVRIVATAEGIDDEGALLLRLDDGRRLPVMSASSLREI